MWCWVGLDRLLQLSKKYNWTDAPIEKMLEVRNKIRETIETAGYNKSLQSYVAELHGNSPDMALLILPLVGFEQADSEKMRTTLACHKNQLFNDGFMYRYPESLSEKEGEAAFVIGNFWLIENLTKAGEHAAALKLFNTTIADMPATGLLTEEFLPEHKTWLGNYPQAFSHIGLINAALSLNEACKKEEL